MLKSLGRELYEIPAEVERLAGLLADLEESEAFRDAQDPTREAFRDAAESCIRLQAQVDAEFAALDGRIQEVGPGLHGWLRRLKALHTAAEEEARRTRAWKERRERAFESVKERVLRLLTGAGLTRVEGPSWRLRVQSNGGEAPIAWDEKTELRDPFLAPVTVSAGFLIVLLRLHGNCQGKSDAEVLQAHGFTPEPDLAAARLEFKRSGKLPAGFVLRERGSHLRVE